MGLVVWRSALGFLGRWDLMLNWSWSRLLLHHHTPIYISHLVINDNLRRWRSCCCVSPCPLSTFFSSYTSRPRFGLFPFFKLNYHSDQDKPAQVWSLLILESSNWSVSPLLTTKIVTLISMFIFIITNNHFKRKPMYVWSFQWSIQITSQTSTSTSSLSTSQPKFDLFRPHNLQPDQH